MSGDYDELIARARTRSEGSSFDIPASWGESIDVDENESFVGRYRGRTEGPRGEAIFLFWDEEEQLRFSWHRFRLEQEMERLSPTVGDTVVIFRGENYKTRFDDDGEASGYAFGVETEPNSAPLPNGSEGTDDDELPF
jgi:hypothetical protein